MTDTPRRRRWRRALIGLGAVCVAGAAAVASSMAHVSASSAGHEYSPDDVPTRDVALVLGAKAHPDRPSVSLASRLDLAVELWEAGSVRAVLVSGDGLPRSNNEPRVMRDYLVARGVPAERIVEDVAGFDTYDSCVRARDVYGATGLTIVTQDYHVPRALTICRSVGLDAVGVGDTSFRERHPSVWARGAGREWLANLKMEWDLLSQREPQQDPASDALLRAVEAD